MNFCKLSEYLYTDILCDWISKGSQDKDILCYGTLDRSQDRLLDTVDKLKLSVRVVRSDWFHYCIIVCAIESILVDYNHYFKLIINLLS